MKHPVLLAILVILPLTAAGIIYDQREKINIFGVRKDSVSASVAQAMRGEATTEGLIFKDTNTPAEAPEDSQAAETQAPVPTEQPDHRISPPETTARPILYFGESCPHCVRVSEFIRQNGIAEKTGLVEKEVSKDQANSSEAIAAAKNCGLDESKMGVPMLVADGKCLVGEDDVVSFLKAKAGVAD